MTAPKSMDPAQFLREQAASADPDVLRAMVKTFADALMNAEADAMCGAPYGRGGAPAGVVEGQFGETENETQRSCLGED